MMSSAAVGMRQHACCFKSSQKASRSISNCSSATTSCIVCSVIGVSYLFVTFLIYEQQLNYYCAASYDVRHIEKSYLYLLSAGCSSAACRAK